MGALQRGERDRADLAAGAPHAGSVRYHAHLRRAPPGYPARPAARRSGPSRSGSGRRAPAGGGGKLDEVVALAHRLCAPLAFIHGEGLVHRDLKPANVFVLRDGTPVLMDFGVVSRARGMIGREALEVAGKVVGTAAYLAPEQARGQRVDARADLYALGCMLYEMTTGQPPFDGPSVAQILQAHLTADPRPPSEIVSGMPPALEGLILQLLAKERRGRMGYADDVAAALTGLGAPVPAPSRPARSYLYRPETVGRAAILADLRGHLEAAVASRGSFVVLGGESGLGKTVVLAEIARAAVARRMQVVVGECLAVGVSSRSELDAGREQLGPMRPLLRAVAGACMEGGRAVAARLLGPRGRLLAPYEPALAAVPGHDDHPAPPELPPEAARERLLAALRDTLVALAEQAPVLLVIDDLQWADELSLRLLRSLADDVFAVRLFVLAAYRSEEANEALRAVVAAPHVRELALGRLDEDEMVTLVGHMLAMASPPPPFVHFLSRHSEGNAFFVAEYLRAAVVAGHLRRRDGAWNLSDGPDGEAGYEALPLPRSLRDVVRLRLDALSRPARDLAELGSVIGRELDGDLLAIASGRPVHEVSALLRELRSRQVLEPLEHGRHRFSHDKVREVAYAGLAPARRRELHAAAGRAIEAFALTDATFAARPAELAHHFRHAGEIPRAIDYLEQAGELALGKLAHEEAVRHFADAIALEPRLPARASPLRRAKWDMQIAEAEHRAGRPVTGRAHAERAAALLDLAVPRSRPLLAVGALFELATQVEHRVWPGRFIAGVLSPEGTWQIAARTYYVLMECSFMGSDSLAILHASLRCLNLAERAGPSPILAHAYAFASVTAATLSLDALSRDYSRHAHATLDHGEDGDARALAHTMDAFSHAARADWGRMYAAGEQAAAVADRLGLKRRREDLQTILAWAELVRGDLAASEARYARMRAARPRLETQAELWIRVGLAAVHVERDRLDEAIEEIGVPEERFAQSAQRAELLGFRTLRAVVHLRRRDPGAARQVGTEALALIRAMSASSLVSLPSYERAAEVFVELWSQAGTPVDRAEQAAASRAACDALARGARLLPIWRPPALLAQGWHAFRAGRSERACSRWEACVDEARTLEMPLHAALAELALGRHGLLRRGARTSTGRSRRSHGSARSTVARRRSRR